MSKTREQRVDDALAQLVDLSLPGLDQEPNNAKADELFQRACNRARDVLEVEDVTPTVQDVDHVANLIRRKRRQNC